MIIAVDGPAASGKGTLAKRLAKHFGLPHLDTGAVYRAVALTLLREGFTPDDSEQAIRIAQNFQRGVPLELFSDPELRSERVSQATSRISALPDVRKHLFDFQQQFANQPQGAVLDGRDIGTVIAPHATAKLFIVANPEKRAERRWKELQNSVQSVTYEAVLDDMRARDLRDASRSTAPAKPADDAVVIDTSNLSIDEAFNAALRAVKEKAGLI